MERAPQWVVGFAAGAVCTVVASGIVARWHLQRSSKVLEDAEDDDCDEPDASSPGRPSGAPRGGVLPGLDSPWDRQIHRPRRIVLIRHGESEANVNRHITSVVPDHMLHLTMKGRRQALEAGKKLKSIVGEESVEFLISPYVRARETYNGVVRAWGQDIQAKVRQAGAPSRAHVTVRDEMLIREQDFGNFDKDTMAELHEEKRDFGQFYYRFPEGESPADVYNRASLFLESLYRRWEHHSAENLVVVSHSMFLLVFMMRFFRYSIGEFYGFEPLQNCELVVLERPPEETFFEVAYTWSPGKGEHRGGLRLKAERAADILSQAGYTRVWNGDPDAAEFSSEPKRRSRLQTLELSERGVGPLVSKLLSDPSSERKH